MLATEALLLVNDSGSSLLPPIDLEGEGFVRSAFLGEPLVAAGKADKKEAFRGEADPVLGFPPGSGRSSFDARARTELLLQPAPMISRQIDGQ